MNVFSFTGNLGRDCRVGDVSGTAVCNFAVAAKAGYGEKEQTLWVDCALWGQRASTRITEYLVKGQQVAVTGELGTREHEGKTYLTCRVSDVTLVGGKAEPSASPSPQPPQRPVAQAPAPAQTPGGGGFDDDIPF